MAFSFGQPAQAAPSPAQPSTFSFGASTAQKPATGGFSFGAPSQASQPSTGGGLFGSQNNTQQQQPQQQTGFGSSLFGSQQSGQPTSQPQTSSLFGNTSNTGGGLFGQQQAQQNKPTFSFASNNNAGPSTSTNPMTLSQMGTQPSYQQQQHQNNSLNQSTGFLGSAGANTNLKDSTSQKRLGIPVNDKLEAIRAAWNVRDIQSCRFLVSIDQNFAVLIYAYRFSIDLLDSTTFTILFLQAVERRL